jgi:2-hydroxy-3-oxopropionate reductase
MQLHRKDAAIILDTAQTHDAPIPAFEVVAERLERAVNEGRGELDHSGLAVLLEEDAGVRVNRATGRLAPR